MQHNTLPSFIWSVADLLRGDYKQSEYGKVILPFTVLRRMDCVLAESKKEVLSEFLSKQELEGDLETFLLSKSGLDFYNTSIVDMKILTDSYEDMKDGLCSYVRSFSPSVRDIFERFDFYTQVDRLSKCGILSHVVKKFATIDLHPKTVSNSQMGMIFEELIRRFAEISNETAGEHFTPRDAIRLMVSLLFIEDGEILASSEIERTIYDPTAGTGGMLSVAGEYLEERKLLARLIMFGQELNDESYAICKADLLIKGQNVSNIIAGNTLSNDGHPSKYFDYMLSNPPFGLEWKKIEKEIRREREERGFKGRFGPGLPRVSDGSLLFFLHLISKMRPSAEGGSRFAIVLNASPLFVGGAGSGESEIRRYVLENDLVEAIIGLPCEMFYNTGIATYIWVLSNRKKDFRKGRVQLIDGSNYYQKMRKSLGNKRREMNDEHIDTITRLFNDFVEVESDGVFINRIFKNEDFGYRTITIERPERDKDGQIVLVAKGDRKGKPCPNSNLRDTENVPLHEDVETYFKREIYPHAPDAWIDHEKTKIGYEIHFNRYFQVYKEPRSLLEIDKELKEVTNRIITMLGALSG